MHDYNPLISNDFNAKELFSSLYKDAKTLVCLIKQDKVVDVNKKCIDSFGYIGEEKANSQSILNSIHLTPFDSNLYSFEATTKKGLKFSGSVLKSNPTSDGFYFGFIKILHIKGLEEYDLAVDQILKTLSAMKELQCPARN